MCGVWVLQDGRIFFAEHAGAADRGGVYESGGSDEGFGDGGESVSERKAIYKRVWEEWEVVDTQEVVNVWLWCKVVRQGGNRVFVDTTLDGHTLLNLEKHLKAVTGNRDLEVLCEEKKDKNALRRLAELRGTRVK